MIHEVFMPALSSTMTEGKIISWVKSPGDVIKKGETVVVVESDKADMDVESFYAGYLAAIVVPAGGTAPVGAAIALIAETQAEIEQAKQKAASGQKSAPATTSTVTITEKQPVVAAAANSSSSNGRIIVSPRAKKLAKELGVDIKNLQGSGPHGRIVAEDVQSAAGQVIAASQVIAVTPAPVITPVITPPTPIAPQAPAPVKSIPPSANVPAVPGEVTPFNSLQQAVVRNMIASQEAVVFHVGYTITTDNLDKLYKQIKSKGVTMTALLAKAVAVTLKKYPIMNASYTDAGIHYNNSINIAIAVAMPGGGLITPVLDKADQIDIYSLSRKWKDLVDRARGKQLQPQEYSTGTFTVSNLGMFGVTTFDAILPPGQGSILAIGASLPQVVATADGMLGIKQQMQVNISCDHRIIYGADAAAFLQDLAKLIETNPQSLAL